MGILALGALVYTARPAPLEDRDSGDCSRLRSFVVIQEGQSITEAVDRFCGEQGMGRSDCASVYQHVLANHPRLRDHDRAPYEARSLISFDPCVSLKVSGTDPPFTIYTDDLDSNATEIAWAACLRHGLDDSSQIERALQPRLASPVAAAEARTRGVRQCPYARVRRERMRQAPAATTSSREVGQGWTQSKLWCRTPSPGMRTCLYQSLYVVEGELVSLALDPGQEEPRVVLRADRGPGEKRRWGPSDLTLEALHKRARGQPILDLRVPVLLLERVEPTSHGHILRDALLPAFWAASEHPETQPFVASRSLQVVFLDSAWCQPLDTWFHAITAEPPVYDFEVQPRLCPVGVVCRLRYAVAGLQNMGIVDAKEPPRSEHEVQRRAAVIAAFRDSAIRALGVDTLTTQGETVITVVQRLHYRHFVNLEELVAHLQASFPYARVEVAVLDHRTIQEQVAVFSTTTVLVAAEGGALDLLVFRHPSLSVVVLGRSPSLPYPVGCLDRSGQCDYQFTHAPFIEVLQRIGMRARLLPTKDVSGLGYVADVTAVTSAVAALLGESSEYRLSVDDL